MKPRFWREVLMNRWTDRSVNRWSNGYRANNKRALMNFKSVFKGPEMETQIASYKRARAEHALSPSCIPWGKFSNFLACPGILRPVTPHRLALCPPLGKIVIFIYQLIATLPALSPPSQETHVKRMKTGRQFHPSTPPSRTPSSWYSIRWLERRDYCISTAGHH